MSLPDRRPPPAADQPPAGSAQIALSVRAHDRAGRLRTDQGWLDDTWADPGTRVLLLAGDRFPVAAGGAQVDWRSPGQAPPGDRLFLGSGSGVAHFAVVLPESAAGDGWTTFRSGGPALSAADRGLLVHALALAEWHRAHRHCPRCGGSLATAEAGHLLTCGSCGRSQFPRTDPAVIMLVVDGQRALLGRSPAWPADRYSTLAGFVEPGESLEQAVVREVAEEVGVRVGDVRYFGNQPWPFPASLMIGFFADAATSDITVDGQEISEARWFTRSQLYDEAAAGRLLLPTGLSISRALIQAWYGGPLPGDR